MADESDMSWLDKIMEPIRMIINIDSPKDELPGCSKSNFWPSSPSSQGSCNSSPTKRKLMPGPSTETSSRTESTDTTTVSPSPLEIKRWKSDVIVAKAQKTRLEAQLIEQQTIHNEMQILFEKEKTTLLDQHKRDEKSLTNMEERLQVIQRSEQHLKDDHSEVLKEFQKAKEMWNKQKTGLQNQIFDLKDKLLEATVSSGNQLSQMKKDKNELLQALGAAQSEVEILKKELTRQTGRAEECTSLRIQLEKQRLEFQKQTNKLKGLEYERDCFNVWQQQAKTAEKRLCNMAELEKEVVRLRSTEKNLRDAIGNKLLLEEQVNVLKSQVEVFHPVQQELHDSKVKLAMLESSLEEWKTVARIHGVDSVNDLRYALETTLHGQLAAVAKCSEAHSQIALLAGEITTVKFERDQAIAKLNDVRTVRKIEQRLLERLQKQLLLVTRDRDSYSQQLEYFEKELAVSVCGQSGIGRSALLLARVEHLEKALQGYRDLLAMHDQESDANKALVTMHLEVSKWREEAESARCENNKLRMQRDQLQAHVERLATSTCSKDQDLHLLDNPATAAPVQMEVDLLAAQEEIKILKAAQGEGVSTFSPEAKQQLEQQLEHCQNELKRMQEESPLLEQEYKFAVYVLFGYVVERIAANNYRITSTYAESENDYFTLKLDNNEAEIVHSVNDAFVQELSALHLHQNKSIPMFLSALTTELFTKQSRTESGVD